MAEYNESQIQSNETQRIAQETERINNEARRNTNEIERQAREDIRITNENTRVEAEEDRIANEEVRINNEVNRVNAEQDRVTRFNEIEAMVAEVADNMKYIETLLEKQSVNIDSFSKEDADTSDSERIQRAIDYASMNKLILKFNSDTYVIDKTIKLKDNTHLFFNDESVLKLQDNTNNINIIENNDLTNGNTNISITGGNIDGNNFSNSSVCGILLVKCRDVNVKKMKVYNCSKSPNDLEYSNSAINFRECIDFYIEGLKVFDNAKVGLQITGDCNGTPYGIITNGVIDNCVFYNNSNSGVDTSGSAQYVTIKNCLAYDNGITENSFQFTINCAYNFIEGCKAYRTVQGQSGGGHFNVGHSKQDFPDSGAFAPNSAITNCVAHGYGVGLNIHSSDNVIVSNFTQIGDEPTLSIINCYLSENVKITGVYGNCGGASEQINIQSCPNITIKDCVISNSARGGIKIVASKNALVENNKIINYNTSLMTSGFSAGISISDLSDNSNICNNIFINDNQTAKRGIYLENSAYVMLLNNRIDDIETPITPLGSSFGENYIDKIKTIVNG